MFSELRKNLFIKQVAKSDISKRAYEALFSRIEPFEKKFDKDLCQFSIDELQQLFNSVFDVRKSTQDNYYSKINTYLNWAVDNSIYGASNHLSEINRDSALLLKKRMVCNPTQLSMILDKVFRPAEECTTETLYRAVYWLAFCGVDIDAVKYLTSGNVDLQNMTITFNEKPVRLYAEAVKSIRICMEYTQLRMYHRNSKDPNSYMWVDRVDGDLLLRGINKSNGIDYLVENAGRKMKSAQKSGKINCNLTYETVKLSGLFYRLHEAEIAGFSPDFYWLAERLSEDREYKTDSKHGIKSALNRVANTYKKDYESWKNAFYK